MQAENYFVNFNIFRALNRSKQLMCKEIQDQMKKIINQGEIIRKHLETIKDFESLDHQQEIPTTGEPQQQNQEKNILDSTVPGTSSSKDVVQNKSDTNSDSAFNDSFLDQPSPKPYPRPNNLSETVSQDHHPSVRRGGDRSVNRHCQESIYSQDKRTVTPHPPPRPRDIVIRPEERGTVVNLLENIHRINCLLQSKEEQVLTLGTTWRLVNDDHADDENVDSEGVKDCFDEEVARYRDLNARLCDEIQENTDHLADLVKHTDARRKMVTQLEFDVNIIERESKRLQVRIRIICYSGA